MRVQKNLCRALGCLILLLSAGLSQAAEFTATTITKASGMEIPGKVYIKGEKIRNEIHAGISIIRPDKNLMWVIIPQQKAYMEMPLTGEAQQKILTMTEKQKAQMKKVGTETVNNYVCDKYETIVSHRGKPTKINVCIIPDMGLPIKMEAQDGAFSMELKDIKTEKVSASLFEPPQGYRKMKMPLSMPLMK